MKNYFLILIIVIAFTSCGTSTQPIVFQTDFGLKDGAVAEMKGVALSVDPSLELYDLTHEIPVFNIWERSEEHTSELQSQSNLVCRLLLEKKKKKKIIDKKEDIVG